jgi:hypothetical protein
MDSQAFEVFIAQCLVPQLWSGAVVVMDNLPAHKVDSIKPMIEAVGASIWEHPDFASMQKYDKIYPFVGKPTLSFPKKSVLESMSHFIAIEE